MAALLAVSAAAAERAAAVAELVRNAIAAHRSDVEIARQVRGVKLVDRLDDRMIETIEGAGPLTLAELRRLRDSYALLPAVAWSLPDSAPAPSAEEQSRIVAQAREMALEYAAGLPNFLCAETVRRYAGKYGSVEKLRDTLTVDVSFNGKTDRYRLRAINGKGTVKSLYEVGGFRSSGDFGGLQRMVFDPAVEASFRWEGRLRIGGRLAQVFSFRFGAAHSQYVLNFEAFRKGTRMIAGGEGMIYLDPETHKVVRLRIEAVGIPPDWAVRRAVSELEYGLAEIAGREYLLPKTSEMRLYTKGGPYRNAIEFGEYRRFAGEASISFEK